MEETEQQHNTTGMSQDQEPTRDEFLSHGIEDVPADEVAAAASNPDAPGGTQECMICLEGWKSREPPEKPVRIIACGHWIGGTCITLLGDNKCPLCRARLFRTSPVDDLSEDEWVPPPSPDDELLTLLAPDFDHLAAALAAALPLARHPFEATAAELAADRDFDRTAVAHSLERGAAPPPPPPTTASGSARDLRPYALVPAFEAVSPRDLLNHRARPFGADRAWLTVRPDAFAANFASLTRAFRAVRAARAPGEEGPAERVWAAVARAERAAVGAWAREHEAELWRAGELRDELVGRARMAVVEEEAGEPVPGAGLVVAVLVDWLMTWRRTREVEVWGGLVMDQEPEEE